MQPKRPSIWLRDSIENASRKPGAVQPYHVEPHRVECRRNCQHKVRSRQKQIWAIRFLVNRKQWQRICALFGLMLEKASIPHGVAIIAISSRVFH